MLILVMAGEAAFLLPFSVIRAFRPTFLDVFQVTNLELGSAFSLYGALAMISYFAGGPIADRYSARSLMSVSLALTAFGGAYLATVPDIYWMTALYGFWGITTILLFWAALIRSTREWGGDSDQAKAFGYLDAGRGLFAALTASLAIWLFSAMLPDGSAAPSSIELREALSGVIVLYSLFVACVSISVWFFIPESKLREDDPKTPEDESKFSFDGLKFVMKTPAVWLQALILVCAYCGYKSSDDFSLYVKDTYGLNDLQAATAGTLAFWIRPFAALFAGWLGDRINPISIIKACFAALVASSLVIALRLISPSFYILSLINILVIGAAVCSMRALYFAIFDQAEVPLIFTGSAVGFVSFLGYTPDIFMGPLMGYLLDTYPGALGHQYLFLVLSLICAVGLIASILFQKVSTKNLGAP
jgi:nitrate/nitrite transporter NarK